MSRNFSTNGRNNFHRRNIESRGLQLPAVTKGHAEDQKWKSTREIDPRIFPNERKMNLDRSDLLV